MRDARLKGLIRKALSAPARETEEHCANDNLMAAYLEANLSPAETDAFEAHVAGCPECQQVLAISMKLHGVDMEGPSAVDDPARRTLFRISIPVPVLGAALIAVLLAAVFLKWGTDSGKNVKEVQVAELRAPAEKVETGQPAAPADAPAAAERKKALPESTPSRKEQPRPAVEPRERAAQGPAAGQIEGEKKEDHAVADLRVAQPALPPGTDAIAPAGNATRAAEEEKRVESAELQPPNAEAERAAPEQPAARLRAAAAPPPPASTVAGALSNRMALQAAPSGDDLFKGKDLSQLSAGESRKIGDKIFYLNSGVWIDRNSAENRDDPVIEMPAGVPEYGKILEKYPEVRELVPVLIRWKSKNYLFR